MMFNFTSLHSLGRGLKASGRHRRRAPVRSLRPHLESLENYQLLSTFTVNSLGDNGTGSGNSGDLRYCIGKADAGHTAAADTITFSATLFGTPQTITLSSANGPLVVDDSHPLTIKGPTGNTVTVSGGDAVEVLDITGGTVSIRNLAISHGNATNGGGISNLGTLTLTDCTVDHNHATNGGGLWCSGGTVKIVGSTFNHDLADFDGGGIDMTGTLTVSGSNLSNNSADGVGGGGIFFAGIATLTNTTLSNDSAPDEDGGGIFVAGGTVQLTGCTFSNDSAFLGGGGVCVDGVSTTVTFASSTLSNDSAGVGGGICNSVGTVTVNACTLSNDTATSGGGGMDNEGTATLTNCTLSNDSAGAGGGGGILNPEGETTVINCTIANNTAVQGSGGGILNESTLILTNTIVAENTAGVSGPDVDNTGTVTTDHDLVGDGTDSGISNGGGNIVGGNGNPVIDPRLGPLQNNGGPTQTLALLADSPAIGQADDAAAPATDQRGHARTDHLGGHTDIGAYEYP